MPASEYIKSNHFHRTLKKHKENYKGLGGWWLSPKGRLVPVRSHNTVAYRFLKLYHQTKAENIAGLYHAMMVLGYVRISLCEDFHVNYGEHGINFDQARAIEAIANDYDDGFRLFELSHWEGDYEGSTDFERFKRNLRKLVRQPRDRKDIIH